MSFVTGKVGKVYKQDDSTLDTMADEAATLGVDTKTLTITDDTKRYLQKSTVIVKKDTVALDPATYEIIIGGVIFYNAQTAGNYTISGGYYDIESIGGFFDYTLDSNTNTEEVTEFGDTDERHIATTNNWKASANYYYKDDSTQQQDFATYMDNQTEVIFVFYWDTANDLRQEGYGTITNLSINTTGKGVTKGKIDFTGNGKLMSITS